jgi:hypothetical protein
MLSRHQCVHACGASCVEGTPTEILVVGGGGNCFSFGSHFNEAILKITIVLPENGE